MVFSSVIFVMIFLPVVLLIHSSLYLFFKCKQTLPLTYIMNLFLLIMSVIFYSWGEINHLIIIAFVTVIVFVFGIIIDKVNILKRKKYILFFGIGLNVSVLCYYKYMNFFTSNLNEFLLQFSPSSIIHVAAIALPLGISFYTFQGISYLIDVYRRDIAADRNFINFASYITMFPQLVAGPIVRYASIQQELKVRKITIERFSHGITRFIYGLAKKILIADTMGRVADICFAIPNGELSLLGAWVGIIAYTLQIYFDFSGYSDMAIGIGHMLGFTFPENFNYPYISKSIQEFWRRWHITLSAWFRDYLYIPLGGNRKGRLRTYTNLMVVFVLCGFWHGASNVFILWGLYHGFFIVLERIFPRILECFPESIKHIYTIIIFMFGWVIFRSTDVEHLFFYTKSLLGSFSSPLTDSKVLLSIISGDFIIALVLGILLTMPILPRLRSYFSGNSLFLISEKTYSILLFILCLLPLFGATYKSFIYFRF